VKSSYYLGDQLTATCLTDPSHPEPIMKWWINDNPADAKYAHQLDQFRTVLSFVVRRQHVSPRHHVNIKCTVEILGKDDLLDK
jgi:hypothetical protein